MMATAAMMVTAAVKGVLMPLMTAVSLTPVAAPLTPVE
jgi:hypothetical protein